MEHDSGSSTSVLVNFTESQGDDDTLDKSLLSCLHKEDDDANSCLQQQPRKRRRFTADHKLEPDRKLQLAKGIGLQLQPSCDTLTSDLDALFTDIDKLEIQAASEDDDSRKSDLQLKEPLDDPIAVNLCQQGVVSAKQVTNLSNLTYDLLVEIAKLLKKLEHFTCFRSVSKSLHAAVKDECFEGIRLRKGTPYLMLPVREDGTNDDVRELYSLVAGESTVVSLKVPVLKKATMCHESLGWLLAVQIDGSMSLLDPFSNMEIPVPHQLTIPEYKWRYTTKKERMFTFIKKMVLSSKPNETSDFIMMVICGDYSSLAFWRPGDEAWNRIDTSTTGFSDVVYDGGEQFYAIQVRGSIWVINLGGGHVECRLIIDREADLGILSDLQNQYILKSIDGSLLCIIRTKEDQYYPTYLFLVYEIDPVAGTLKEISSLGSMAIFLGRNSSIALDALKYPTERGVGVIKAKHIYFTDDFSELQDIYFTVKGRVERPDFKDVYGGCVDSGVYNYHTAGLEPLYPVEPLLSHVCAAMFINPNLSF